MPRLMQIVLSVKDYISPPLEFVLSFLQFSKLVPFFNCYTELCRMLNHYADRHDRFKARYIRGLPSRLVRYHGFTPTVLYNQGPELAPQHSLRKDLFLACGS